MFNNFWVLIEFFIAFDTDNSGSIDFQEFLVAFNIIGDGDVEKRLAWMFDVYDINKDGSIDRKEIDTILRVMIFFTILLITDLMIH